MPGEFIVIYDLIPEMAARIEEMAGKAVRKAAFDVAANAIPVAPVDTGFLKNSIYVKPGEEDGENPYSYDRVQQPEGDQQLFEEVAAPGKLEAIVAVGATYGWFVEYGTSRAAAQPFFTPAVEKVKPELKTAMEHVIEKIAG